MKKVPLILKFHLACGWVCMQANAYAVASLMPSHRVIVDLSTANAFAIL